MRTQRRKGNNLKKGVALFLVLLLAFAGSLVTFAQVGCQELILDRDDLVPLDREHEFTAAGGKIWVQVDQNTVGPGKNEMIQYRTDGTIEITSGPTYTRSGGSGQIKQVSFTICPIVPEPIIYTVTFDGNGGTPATQTEDVEEGETVGTLPTVSQEGYSFVEWNTNVNGEGDEFTTDTEVSGNITVYAIWSEVQVARYTVTYDDRGADGGTVPVDENSPYAAGDTVTVLGNPGNIYKIAYVWEGWYREDPLVYYVEGDTFEMPAADVILYPDGRRANVFTVTFDGNGGTPDSTQENVYEGATVESLPTVTREEYTFVEWNTDMNGEGDEFTADTVVNGDITVYAIWTPVGGGNGGGNGEVPDPTIYTVTFNGNSGSPSEQTREVEDGKTVESLPSVSRSGYTFVRWDTASNGTGTQFNSSTVVVNDITVYAIWNERPSTGGGGSDNNDRDDDPVDDQDDEELDEMVEISEVIEIPEAAPIMEIPVLDEAPLAGPPVLPQTGEAGALATILSGLGVSLSGLAMKFRKKGKTDSVTTLYK